MRSHRYQQSRAEGSFGKQRKKIRKGNQWHFGMKAHIRVDSRSKLIHSVTATAANVNDSRVLDDLLHGEQIMS